MSENISKYTQCANCGACYNICPQKAITVSSDSIFYQVQVDEEKCVGCGLCLDVCPVNKPENHQNLQKAYGAIHRDNRVVKNSSSGGVFSAVAQYVIDQGGVVFGAVYSEDFTEVSFASTDTLPLDALRRSKYVESRVNDCFQSVKAQLQNDRMVLFCGAPCQVAGLKRYLKKDYEKLITCDFSCGGLPAHGIYQQYLQELQEMCHQTAVTDVNFRPKDYGWQIHSIRVRFSGEKQYKGLNGVDPYFYAFLHSGTSKREYCYSCEFGENHYADLILADFWKYASISDYPRNDRGLSLVLTNSPKGEQILEKVGNILQLKPLQLESAAYNIKKNTPQEETMKRREAFLADVAKMGVFKAAQKQGMSGNIQKAKRNGRIAKAKNRIKALLKLH